jgi:hypothetical protein
VGEVKRGKKAATERSAEGREAAAALGLFDELPPPVIISDPPPGHGRPSVRWDNRLNDLAALTLEHPLDHLRPSSEFDWCMVTFNKGRIRLPLQLPVEEWNGRGVIIPTTAGITLVSGRAAAVELGADFWMPNWRHEFRIDSQRRVRVHREAVAHLGLRFFDRVVAAVDRRRAGVLALHLLAPEQLDRVVPGLGEW